MVPVGEPYRILSELIPAAIVVACILILAVGFVLYRRLRLKKLSETDFLIYQIPKGYSPALASTLCALRALLILGGVFLVSWSFARFPPENLGLFLLLLFISLPLGAVVFFYRDLVLPEFLRLSVYKKNRNGKLTERLKDTRAGIMFCFSLWLLGTSLLFNGQFAPRLGHLTTVIELSAFELGGENPPASRQP